MRPNVMLGHLWATPMPLLFYTFGIRGAPKHALRAPPPIHPHAPSVSPISPVRNPAQTAPRPQAGDGPTAPPKIPTTSHAPPINAAPITPHPQIYPHPGQSPSDFRPYGHQEGLGGMYDLNFQIDIRHHLGQIAHPDTSTETGTVESINRFGEIWAFSPRGFGALPVALRPDILGKLEVIQLKALNSKIWNCMNNSTYR